MSNSPKKHSTERADSTSEHEGNGEAYFVALVGNPKASGARRCMAARWLLENSLSTSAAISGLKALLRSPKARPATRDRARRMLHKYERTEPQNEVDDPNSEFNRSYAEELRAAPRQRRVKARQWLGLLPYTDEQADIIANTPGDDDEDGR